MILKNYISLFLLFTSLVLTAQTNADFENFNLPAESVLNGSDGSGGFASGNVFLSNSFSNNFWSGWLVSNSTDNSTGGYTNDFSTIAGSGADGTSTYAVTFVGSTLGDERIMNLTGEAVGNAVTSMYVTNNAYAYLSMLDGDGFAKKFGGTSGDDPDYFLLTIKKYLNGQLSTESIEFYLADYRFADNSQDYIVDEWTLVDLTSLGSADSLSFSLTSTDVGMFGMNTPSYFCIDEVITSDGITSVDKIALSPEVELYPNPASEVLNLNNLPSNSRYIVYNSIGQAMMVKEINDTTDQLDLKAWLNGTYILEVWNEEHVERQLFIKQ